MNDKKSRIKANAVSSCLAIIIIIIIIIIILIVIIIILIRIIIVIINNNNSNTNNELTTCYKSPWMDQIPIGSSMTLLFRNAKHLTWTFQC